MKINHFRVLIIILSILFFCSCKKEKPTLPVITTLPITKISYTSAISGGEVKNEGSSPIRIIGLCWNTSPNPTVNNFKTTHNGFGHFVDTITNLTPNKVYYVRAYFICDNGTGYGNEVLLSSNELKVPLLTTSEITLISQENATSGGCILDENGSNVFEKGICWSTKPNPTIEDNKLVDLSGTGIFVSSLSHLSSSTVYYVRAYASNSNGTGYGNELSFKTLKHCIVFTKTYTYPNAYITLDGFSIENTTDGGYIAAGNISLNGDGYDLLVIKLDSIGNEMWNSVIEMHQSNGYGTIRQTTDHGYIVSNGSKITKLDENGRLLWMYPQGSLSFNSYCAIETLDANYLVAGYCDTIINGIGKTMATITKFSQEGLVLWKKSYGAYKQNFGKYICKTNDGNYIMLGNSGTDSYYDTNFFVMKFDINGNTIWEQRYTDEKREWPEQIKLTSDDGFIISGYSYRERNISDARILKIDNKGNLLWNKSYFFDLAQNFKTYAYGIEQTKDGGYIFTGGNGYSPEEGLLVKLDQSGNVSWEKHYKPDYMDYIWIGYDVKQTNDLGYIITGRKSWVWTGSNKEDGLWFLKTDEFGNFKY